MDTRLNTTGQSFDNDLSDRELLHRFDRQKDEVAFSTLMRRHGPMVLSVCQRVLDRQEDAEDVFQATFLVLVRKVRTVSWRESVAAWLHEAAHRLAQEVRRNIVRRSIRDRNRQPGTAGDTLAEVTGRELLTILDEELLGLPEKYRAPVLLCCLEGMSGDEAARHLGCSESTLKRRLRHGRELLRSRLSRRGVALSVAALGTLLTAGMLGAAAPTVLAARTVQAAAAVTRGGVPAGGLVTPSALSLAQGQFATTASLTLKLLVGSLVVGGVGLVVAGGIASRGGEGGGAGPATPALAPGRPIRTAPAVLVTTDTTLRAEGGNIRQFAFDSDSRTAFISTGPAKATDHFTLRFDRPVRVRAVRAWTNETGGGGRAAGRLEVSADGIVFEPAAEFSSGFARCKPDGRDLVAVRIRPAGNQAHPLVVREVEVDSEPALTPFRYPVEFRVDASAAPDMTAWANQVAQVCERHYGMICEELSGADFHPPTVISFAVKEDASALVGTADGHVTASAPYFRTHPEDVGAVIHAISCAVQDYRKPGCPGWLVQGIADYIRFYKFEPGAADPPNPATARYDGESRETAAFLDFLVRTRDAGIVRRVNAALRDGRYADDVWREYTGLSLPELGDEWRRSLRR